MSFWHLQFSKKTNEKIRLYYLLKSNCFRSFFGRIEDTKKTKVVLLHVSKYIVKWQDEKSNANSWNGWPYEWRYGVGKKTPNLWPWLTQSWNDKRHESSPVFYRHFFLSSFCVCRIKSNVKLEENITVLHAIQCWQSIFQLHTTLIGVIIFRV